MDSEDIELEAPWWEDDESERAQGELPAGEQGSSQAPGTAPADFGDGVFEDD